MQRFYVYILTNVSRTLYVGVTNDLERRLWEHRQRQGNGFTARYNITLLAHVEEYANPRDAIAREKEIKAWRREKKIALIAANNPEWQDLSKGWFE